MEQMEAPDGEKENMRKYKTIIICSMSVWHNLIFHFQRGGFFCVIPTASKKVYSSIAYLYRHVNRSDMKL